MAYLNGEWFEHDIPMHGKSGDICVETGYEKELLFAKHAPQASGVYWLYLDNYTADQRKRFGGGKPSWLLVSVGRGVGPLRTLHYAFGGEGHLNWFDFSQASWQGPVQMPTPPEVTPNLTAALRY